MKGNQAFLDHLGTIYEIQSVRSNVKLAKELKYSPKEKLKRIKNLN